MKTDFEKEFSGRVLDLPGGRRGLRAGLPVTVTVPKDADTEGQAVIDVRSSDETLDRYDEIVSVAGWRLEPYRKNPVVQNAHRYESTLDTIGKAVVTEVRGDHLFQRLLFAVAENPFAKITHALYKGGFLHAVSVGFIPVRWEYGNEQATYRRKFLEQELLEVSAVSVPANPNALELGIKSGAVEPSDLRELAQILKHFCTEKAATGPNAGVTGSGSDVTQLARLTAEWRTALDKVK